MITYLEYNSERNELKIPEYGRNIQKMVEYAKTIDDDEKRNNTAKNIIDVMGNMNPHLRDVPDFQHKLWDQLFIISNFELDVDSPFPKPSRDELYARPEPLPYPQNFPKYRFYGNNIKRMIDEAIKIEDGELKDGLMFNIANHMKKCYLNWNKDSVSDKIIFDHLRDLSDGKLDLKADTEELSDANALVRQVKKHSKPQKKNFKSNNRNRKRKY
ncbi:DUF4290 domain-containing protein [Psychroflexus sp. CAK57W]|uniref:DUF4290 domain-containing protein n=1 Tax=Psychroflexus curvus TaxID=2873595 RepID=UPI001CCFA8D7|nr:DUF4290 domain-containing protein [Psychroflexus curvus]MBZ9626867.1 DUF4290 domain-containing protein [Psychroflexus curvus]MBZ9786641.1 DUF4290 domain-containing protein [Psychroflexus curvus]